MQEKLAQSIRDVVKELFNQDIDPEITRPAEQFGDYATNVALRLAKDTREAPHDIATKIVERLQGREGIEKVQIAGPGFINIWLTDQVLISVVTSALVEGETFGNSTRFKDQVIVTEYSDPNPFKVLHAGHLYTSVVGDAISNIFERAGATVYRVNFGGDVGLHVGKTMWAILKRLGGENPEKLDAINDKAEWLTEAYVEGNNAYEDDETVKRQIQELNKQIYQVHTTNDHESPFAVIYWRCREWSYQYFDEFYASIGTKFDKYYPESETAPLGLDIVTKQLEKGVFEKSDGAVIFDGEKYGLHTRVFINSEGLPTYEAKDVGLIFKKEEDYHFDRSVVITGNDIVEYMKVVLKAIEQFAPKLSQSTTHIPHGIVKLQGGTKMSSRKGNILRAADILKATTDMSQEATGNNAPETVLAAVKYAFLKQGIGADIIYDPKESVSILGNSGPYLQYAYARAQSIIRKAEKATGDNGIDNLDQDERALACKISEFPEVVINASLSLMPNHIATYAYELAQAFNSFYEKNRIVGHEREIIRLQLLQAYSHALKNSLSMLGINAPDQM